MARPSTDRLNRARTALRRRYRLPESPAVKTMRELAAWMRDPNRKDGRRSYPHRLFDFDALVQALGPFATYSVPVVRLGAQEFKIDTQPGGIDITALPNAKP